ncbi:hypothetical protein POTOM_022729 [Populus tomentosa]|uniref:Ankyrin repeat family protein n=1 Tax=Populus tomentosa TaxID=118781 RepID=A0A8X7ZP26_POPTO|nr:hypothetical protein POTOM_022729 [Populus tomentosa]
MAAVEITDDININAAIDSVQNGRHHHNIELVVVPQQLPPTGDGVERRRHLQLYQAALSGDWDTAEGIYESFPGELVGKMSMEALTYKNEAGNTAFCFAAISGVEALAKVMMDEKRDLAMTRGRGNLLPIYMATLLGHRGMVSYLYDETDEQLTDDDRIKLLVALINSDIYDVAWKMLREHRGLAYARDEHQLTALHAFAQKSCMPSNVVDQSPPGFWNKCLNPFSGFKLARMKKLMHKEARDIIQDLWEQVVLLDDATISRQIGEPWPLIFTAAERGNLDFLTILIRLYPELIFKVEHNTYSIFHISILNRHEDIFKIIYQIGSIKNLITTYKDRDGNNMLHLAAKVLESPSRLNVIPGAALQLLWSYALSQPDSSIKCGSRFDRRIRLIIGLTTLFISIGAMMVAFMATFFLVFGNKLLPYSIPIAVVASLPVMFFIWQHFRLFVDMIHSTYTSRSLFKPNKSPLFSKKLKTKVA